MKKKFIVVAASALGALGTAGLIAASPAGAACNDGDPPPPDGPAATPPLTPARIACVTNANIAEFQRTTSPQYNLDVLLNGQIVDGDNTGLGLNDQLGTFQNSITGPGGFLDGPREPDTAPESGSGF